jgi:hypothetical protein
MLDRALTQHLHAAGEQPLGLARFAVLETGWVLSAVEAMLAAAGDPKPAAEAPSLFVAACNR